jgi:ACS family D-galactonate transporter-like MFS transporter
LTQTGRGIRPWATTALCASFMAINYADKVIIGLAANPIMKELRLSPQQFGLLGSAFFLLYSLSSIGVSFIVDKVEVRRLIAASSLIWALTLLPVTIAASFGVLLISRVILGAAEGPSIALANLAAFEWFPRDRRAIPSSIVSIGSSVGVLVSAPILAWVIKVFGWHMAFFALGVVGLAWIPLWLSVAKEGPFSASGSHRSSGEPTVEDAGGVPTWRLLIQPTFLGALACAYASFAVLALVISWLPLLLTNGEGVGSTNASWVVSLAWLIELLFVLTAGWASTRLVLQGSSSRTARGWLAAGLICSAGVGLWLAIWFAEVWVRISMIILAFSLAQAVWPLLFALISDYAPPPRRGALASLFTGLFTTAGLVVPALMGYFVQVSAGKPEGYDTGLLYLGGFAIIGGLIGFCLINPEADRRRTADSEAPLVSVPT